MTESIRTDSLVRAATTDDAGEIARIYNHYVAAGGATFATVPITSSDVETMIRDGEATDGWYVAEVDGQQRLLGWASARSFSDRYGYRLSCETAIYMMPESTGTGVADRLQHCIHQHCIENRLHHAMAKIIATNERSLKFHYRHGYTLVGIQQEIGHMNDQWLDVAILQRLFSEEPSAAKRTCV